MVASNSRISGLTRLLALLFGAAVFAALIGLGTWQIHRLQWKEALIGTINDRTHSAPLPLADIEQKFATAGDVDYWPVTVTGEFMHEGQAAGASGGVSV